MPRAPAALDWSRVQVFLAVVEAGSLSAAARTLGLSQPTVGRHIAALEAGLGAVLFRRRRDGLDLTEAGAALVEPARAMREAAERLGLAAAGGDAGLSGTVRVTASVFVAHHVLPPILAELRRAHPEIALDLVANDLSDNLLYREADIAVRMYRPTQLDIVARHLGDVRLGLFGATRYLDRVGRPQGTADLARLDVIGYDRNDEILRGFRAAGWEVDRDFFAVRCDHQTTYWELVRAGCGVGFGQRGAGGDGIKEIALDMPLPVLPVWLAAPETVRRIPRVAAVWDALAQGLTAHIARATAAP
ncbi:LysR family transcriptional regulator [Rhodobacteraceae bacterium CCMM004]|nr:LysR family transcriptional regulator [Rhodobacteraceae bacterium CCMM004]